MIAAAGTDGRSILAPQATAGVQPTPEFEALRTSAAQATEFYRDLGRDGWDDAGSDIALTYDQAAYAAHFSPPQEDGARARITAGTLAAGRSPATARS